MHTESGTYSPGSQYGNYEYATFIKQNLAISKVDGIEDCTRIQTKINTHGHNLRSFQSLNVQFFRNGSRGQSISQSFLQSGDISSTSSATFTNTITPLKNYSSWNSITSTGAITILITAYRSSILSGGELSRLNFEDLDIYEIKFLK